MIDFKEVQVRSSKMREHNDCAVRALSIVANKPYEEVHAQIIMEITPNSASFENAMP